ncbi:MAG: acylphosphatase [Candidatus Kapaibacterium sp.]
MRAIRIIVKGLVQGVGFRYYCYKTAKEYGISGYVKNLYNGDVEILAQGEEGLLNDFIRRVNIGPPMSKVTTLHKEETKYDDKMKTFEVY